MNLQHLTQIGDTYVYWAAEARGWWAVTEAELAALEGGEDYSEWCSRTGRQVTHIAVVAGRVLLLESPAEAPPGADVIELAPPGPWGLQI